MLTKADEMNAEMRKLDADIAILDRDIEGRERRISMVRQQREHLWQRRATLQCQLVREEAPRAQLTGPCVIEKAHDGVEWKV